MSGVSLSTLFITSFLGFLAAGSASAEGTSVGPESSCAGGSPEGCFGGPGPSCCGGAEGCLGGGRNLAMTLVGSAVAAAFSSLPTEIYNLQHLSNFC